MLSLPNEILYNHIILELDDFALKMLLCTSKHFMKCYKTYHKCNHENCNMEDKPGFQNYLLSCGSISKKLNDDQWGIDNMFYLTPQIMIPYVRESYDDWRSNNIADQSKVDICTTITHDCNPYITMDYYNGPLIKWTGNTANIAEEGMSIDYQSVLHVGYTQDAINAFDEKVNVVDNYNKYLEDRDKIEFNKDILPEPEIETHLSEVKLYEKVIDYLTENNSFDKIVSNNNDRYVELLLNGEVSHESLTIRRALDRTWDVIYNYFIKKN